MTLQEAKDQVAKNNGWEDWKEVINWHNREKLQNEIGEFVDEVSELYARSQVNEAVNKAIMLIAEDILILPQSARTIIEELQKLKR